MYIMSKAYFDNFVEMYVMSKHTLTVGGCVNYVKAYFDSWRTCTLCQSILWQLGDMYIMSKHTLTVGGYVHYVKAYFDSWWTCTLCQSILWQGMCTLCQSILWQLTYMYIYFDSWGMCILGQNILRQLVDMSIMSKHTLTICGNVHESICGSSCKCACQSTLWWSVELYMPKHTVAVYRL